MNLTKNFLRVFSANMLILVSGLITGFVIPGILSVDQYSNLKTITFYASYITVLHFGFCDGIFLKYGRLDQEDINNEHLKFEHKVMQTVQYLIATVILLFGIYDKNVIILLVAITIVPTNMLSFHQQFAQAKGDFKTFVAISYATTLIYTLACIVGGIFKIDNYLYFASVSILSSALVYFVLEFRFVKENWSIKSKYYNGIWEIYKSGIPILLGNFVIQLFYAIDRWFIKLFYSNTEFAYFSFALSMLSVIDKVISAISIVFYSYFFKIKEHHLIYKLKIYIVIISSFASFSYFAFATIIQLFLKNYIPSLSIIAISFASFPYMFVILSIFVNLYKTGDNKIRYVKMVGFMTGIAILYNAVGMFFYKKYIVIALATTLVYITWYFLGCYRDFKYLKPNKKELIYLSVSTISFLITSHIENWIIGAFMYLAAMTIISFSIYKEYMLDIIVRIFSIINQRKKK